jgi:hypothetical protein
VVALVPGKVIIQNNILQLIIRKGKQCCQIEICCIVNTNYLCDKIYVLQHQYATFHAAKKGGHARSTSAVP